MAFPIAPSMGNYQGMSGNYIPVVFSGTLLVKYYKTTVLAAIASTNYAGEITKMGDEVVIRAVPTIKTFKYKIGQGYQFAPVKTEKISLKIDQGTGYTYPVNSVEVHQSDIAFLESWAAEAAEQVKIDVDREVLANIPLYVSTNTSGATAGAITGNINLGASTADGSTALAVTKETVMQSALNASQALGESNVPGPDRWIVVPEWFATRIKASEISEASYAGDGQPSTLLNGRLGVIAGNLTLYTSNNILPMTEGSVKCYQVVFGHVGAHTFASQFTEHEEFKNPDDYGQMVAGLQVWGHKVLKKEGVGCLYVKEG